MAELLFNFRDLTSVSDPKAPIINLSSLVIPDSVVRKFNPKRYNFYIKFINGLSNPANLYKFLYTTRDSKNYHEDIQAKISKIAKGLKLLSTEDRKNVIANLKKVLDTTTSDKYTNLFNTIETFEKKGGADKEYGIRKPIMPMNTLLTHVNKTIPSLGETPITTIDELILPEGELNSENNKREIKNINISEVKGIYDYYNKIPQLSPERININMIDRGVFILTTLIIRIISLSLIYWGLNSNLINNFKTAYIYYCCIYILFFIFIIGIVNVVFYYPIIELFSNVSISSMPNILYYFYIHITGPNRLILHILLILLLLLIPYILDMDKKKIKDPDMNISFDNNIKTDIYNSIANFSLVIWVLTSIIAIKF
jgi:hypothetical protein